MIAAIANWPRGGQNAVVFASTLYVRVPPYCGFPDFVSVGVFGDPVLPPLEPPHAATVSASTVNSAMKKGALWRAAVFSRTISPR